MSAFDTVLASLAGTQLTLTGLVRWLQTQGRLEPLVREALAAQVVREAARHAGLSVTDAELQTAADGYRRRQGLIGAADTQSWLAARGLSEDDFEANLEQELLADKLRHHLTASGLDGHFAANQADFDLFRLTLVLAPREDLARELVSQVREEGRGLAEASQEQGLPLESLERLRKDLNGPLGSALKSAEVGELVGPVATPRGFALVVIEECRPSELDGATRQRIRDELFGGWLASRMREATLNLSPAGVS
jgi:hypothetical protein